MTLRGRKRSTKEARFGDSFSSEYASPEYQVDLARTDLDWLSDWIGQAWKELVHRIGKQEAARILKGGLVQSGCYSASTE